MVVASDFLVYYCISIQKHYMGEGKKKKKKK